MTHNNLKALGLTLFAVIAISGISATGAGAAQPHAFKSEADSTILTASDHTEAHKLSLAGENLECGVTNFSGTQTGQEAVELTITPTYDECTYDDITAEFRTNHCGYVLTAVTTEHAEQKHARVGIDCENAGEHLEVEIPSLTHCVFTIVPAPGQTEPKSTKGVTYTNAEGEITVDFTAEFTFERDEGSFICNLLDEEGTATWTGNLLLKGYEDKGTPTTANEALTWTADETATTEARGTTHWDWSEKEGAAVDIEVGEPAPTHAFKSEADSTVLTASDHTEAHKLSLAGENLECGVTNFSGTQTGQEATELTITPTYDECVYSELSAEFRTNHCGYVLTAVTTEHAEQKHARVGIDCENAGEHLEVELPSINHCVFTIVPSPGQTEPKSTKGVTYTNAEGEITIDFTAEFTFERDEGSFICNLLDEEGTATWTGNLLLKGYEDKGTPSTANEALTWTADETATTEARGTTHWDWSEKEGAAVDIEVGEPAPTHAFKSEASSTVLTADSDVTHEFAVFGSVVKCEVINFSGTQSGQEATELTITPTYDECEWQSEHAQVRTNHCGYIFTSTTTTHDGETDARVEVECEKEGEHIEIEVPTLGHCNFTVAPQKTTKGVTYKNVEDEEGNKDVTVDITAEVTAERDTGSFLCNLLPSHGTGVYDGASTLTGYEDKGTPSTANEALTFTADETATTEARGITHWDWSEMEGSQVDIEVDGA